MGGVNPYISKYVGDKPTKPFKITFIIEETGEKREMIIDPEKIPFGHTGLEGSILDIAEGANIEIDHACGGVSACATCHVHVLEGSQSCNEASDDEEDMLDTARDLSSDSRLSCQCVPNGTQDLTVKIPKWNKNMVKEAPH